MALGFDNHNLGAEVEGGRVRGAEVCYAYGRKCYHMEQQL